jgi:hypothetical protein
MCAAKAAGCSVYSFNRLHCAGRFEIGHGDRTPGITVFKTNDICLARNLLLPRAGVKAICVLPDAIAEIQRRILRYLVEHRFAKDTVEGITEWWLRNLKPRPSLSDVEEALEGLVAKGWLVKIGTSSTQTFDQEKLRVTERQQHLFGLKESHLAEIEEFLRP